jgi:hypothetical protein
MSQVSVFCLAASQCQADAIVIRLRAAGFTNDTISVIMPNDKFRENHLTRSSTKCSQGSVTGAGAGGVAGGALGLLVGIGAISLPDFGPLVAAGPILAAMGGAALGAAVGVIAGGLIGLGLPEYKAMEYEGRIRTGNILISVHAKTPSELTGIQEIFLASGAQDITSVSENIQSGKSWTERRPLAQARRFA